MSAVPQARRLRRGRGWGAPFLDEDMPENTSNDLGLRHDPRRVLQTAALELRRVYLEFSYSRSLKTFNASARRHLSSESLLSRSNRRLPQK